MRNLKPWQQRMFEQKQANATLLNLPDLWEGLNCLDVGLFTIDQDGYLKQCNSSAARVFGFDDETGWQERHITSVDRMLSTGLADSFAELRSGSKTFARKGVKCTNACGDFLDLDLFCIPVHSDNGHNDTAMGVIRP